LEEAPNHQSDGTLTVETILDSLLRTYTPEPYQQKCDLVYQHMLAN